MKLSVLGSSSSGNGYLLQTESEAIIIECGCPLLDCERMLDFDLQKVKGVLLSHEHGDHAKFAKLYASIFPLYASKGTLSAISIGDAIKTVEMKEYAVYNVGNFRVLAFPTKHDAKQPVGFVIDCPDKNRVVFATDTFSLPYNFKGVDYMMVECNYEDKILSKNVKNGNVHPQVAARTRVSHLSLRRCLQVLQRTRHSLKGVILLHLSDNNSSPQRFKSETEGAIGKPVYVAQKGLELELL